MEPERLVLWVLLLGCLPNAAYSERVEVVPGAVDGTLYVSGEDDYNFTKSLLVHIGLWDTVAWKEVVQYFENGYTLKKANPDNLEDLVEKLEDYQKFVAFEPGSWETSEVFKDCICSMFGPLLKETENQASFLLYIDFGIADLKCKDIWYQPNYQAGKEARRKKCGEDIDKLLGARKGRSSNESVVPEGVIVYVKVDGELKNVPEYMESVDVIEVSKDWRETPKTPEGRAELSDFRKELAKDLNSSGIELPQMKATKKAETSNNIESTTFKDDGTTGIGSPVIDDNEARDNSPSNGTTNTKGNEGLATWAIALIVIVMLIVLLIAVGVGFLWLRRKKRMAQGEKTQASPGVPTESPPSVAPNPSAEPVEPDGTRQTPTTENATKTAETPMKATQKEGVGEGKSGSKSQNSWLLDSELVPNIIGQDN